MKLWANMFEKIVRKSGPAGCVDGKQLSMLKDERGGTFHTEDW